HSYSTATVVSHNDNSAINNKYAGGFCGFNTHNGVIENCYATGDVSCTGPASVVGGSWGRSNVGGFCGVNGAWWESGPGYISDCYATGDVYGQTRSVGGFVGVNYDGSTISDCYATGTAKAGWELVGGFIGVNTIQDDGGNNPPVSTVTNCYATGSVSGTEIYTGGLVGCNYGQISNCHSSASISGHNGAGGLTACNESGASVTNCYSIGSVSGTGLDVGG
ncbi:MAG: hypothetical protein GY869_05275, partial [Planctomycetes bacterium]|nr:hypothetical protein [Planctomycetota bacterium]